MKKIILKKIICLEKLGTVPRYRYFATLNISKDIFKVSNHSNLISYSVTRFIIQLSKEFSFWLSN